MAYGIEERLSVQVDERTAAGGGGRRSFGYCEGPGMSLMLVYYSSRGLVLMLALTVLLLLLPLLLPPLPPPPPFALLLIPIAIMAVLVFLAVTPPQLPNVAFTSV